MSKRNALLAAIIAAVVLAAFFFWPEPARADVAISARIGGGGHHLAGRLHGGDGGLRGRVHLADGRVNGRVRFGGRDLRGDRGYRKGGPLLGDRFRHHTYRRVGGGKGAMIGDRFRFEQQRRLDADLLWPDDRRGRRDKFGHDFRRDRLAKRFHHDRFDRDRFGDKFDRGRLHGDKFDRHKFSNRRLHRDRIHGGKWRGHERYHRKGPFQAPLLLPYGGANVIVREVIVPVPAPVPDFRQTVETAERQPHLDPRGRATLVGGGAGGVGDWAPGDVLPDNVPHVTLDPAAYGLPEPPPGEKYARVGNDVLRIDAASRRIADVVAR